MVDLLSVYVPLDIANLKFVNAYPVFNHYCNEIVRLVARDKKYLDSKPDSELTLAGVEKLSKFEEMRIVDMLAGGDMLKYKEIENLEYDFVFKKLWYMKEQHDLSVRLNKIRNRKQAA